MSSSSIQDAELVSYIDIKKNSLPTLILRPKYGANLKVVSKLEAPSLRVMIIDRQLPPPPPETLNILADSRSLSPCAIKINHTLERHRNATIFILGRTIGPSLSRNIEMGTRIVGFD